MHNKHRTFLEILKKEICFFHAAYPCLRQSVAVAVIRCLRRAPLGHAASSCWLRAYVRGSGLPGTPPSFLSCLLWHSSSSVVNCSLVLRAAYAAVCDCYRFQSATSFLRPSSLFLSPGPPTTRCCECSRHPWGMCLLLLRWSFLSHFPTSLCFDWA